MSNQEKLVEQITNHLRKSEELIRVSKSVNRLLENEVKCLHACLENGAALLELKVPEGGVVIQGGGSKEKPN